MTVEVQDQQGTTQICHLTNSNNTNNIIRVLRIVYEGPGQNAGKTNIPTPKSQVFFFFFFLLVYYYYLFCIMIIRLKERQE